MVSWHVPRRRRFRTRIVPEEVAIVNMSATGAAIVAQTVPELEVEQRVVIEYREAVMRATIARIVPGVEEGTSYYGVQFIDPDPDLLDRMLSHANVAPRELLELYWSQAS